MKSKSLLIVGLVIFTTALKSTAQIYMNFDSVNVGSGAADATAYLALYGVILTDVSTPGSVYIESDQNFYGGGAVSASSPHNFLLQQVGGTGESYTLDFNTPLESLTFTRCAIGGGTASAIWSATAYEGVTDLGSVGDPYIDGDTGTAAQTYTFTASIGSGGINSLIVYGNPENFAALGSAPLDDFYMTPVPEPSAAALLGLGSLVALLRSRRSRR